MPSTFLRHCTLRNWSSWINKIRNLSPSFPWLIGHKGSAMKYYVHVMVRYYMMILTSLVCVRKLKSWGSYFLDKTLKLHSALLELRVKNQSYMICYKLVGKVCLWKYHLQNIIIQFTLVTERKNSSFICFLVVNYHLGFKCIQTRISFEMIQYLFFQ